MLLWNKNAWICCLQHIRFPSRFCTKIFVSLRLECEGEGFKNSTKKERAIWLHLDIIFSVLVPVSSFFRLKNQQNDDDTVDERN